MEWKIGEIKQVNGEWYQCVVAINGCRECSFRAQDYCTRHSECLSDARSDGISVIFKKLEKIEESTFKSCYFGMVQLYKLPYWNNGMVEPVGCHFTGDGYVLIEIKQNKEDMGDNDDIRPYDELFSPGTVSNTKYLAKEDMEDLDKIKVRDYTKVEELNVMEENKLNLKPFDIQKAREGKPVCTRDRRRARIICWDKIGNFPIVALVMGKNNKEAVFYYNGNGRDNDAIEKDYDLMMLPEKKEGWVNVYKERIYSTKEEAIEATYDGVTYVDTVKISWEE